MNLPRYSELIHLSAAPAAAPSTPPPRNPTVEDRDWYASSRELKQGLVVQEFSETIPAGLFDLG